MGPRPRCLLWARTLTLTSALVPYPQMKLYLNVPACKCPTGTLDSGYQVTPVAWPYHHPCLCSLIFMLERAWWGAGPLLMGASGTWQPKAPPPASHMVSASLHLFKPKSQEGPQSSLTLTHLQTRQLCLQNLPTAWHCSSPPLPPPRPALVIAWLLPPVCPTQWPDSGPTAQHRARHRAGVGGEQISGWWGPAGWAEGDKAGPFTEQQAASKARREQELATNAFQELDDDVDGV